MKFVSTIFNKLVFAIGGCANLSQNSLSNSFIWYVMWESLCQYLVTYTNIIITFLQGPGTSASYGPQVKTTKLALPALLSCCLCTLYLQKQTLSWIRLKITSKMGLSVKVSVTCMFLKFECGSYAILFTSSPAVLHRLDQCWRRV